MAAPSLISLQKSKQSLHDFSMKGTNSYCPSCSSSSSSTSKYSSMKFKTLIHSHFLRHVCQVVQAFNKAKSMFMELLLNKNRSDNNNNNNYYFDTFKMKIKRKKKKKNKVFSSIRLHYNWCSSHVLPMPDEVVLPVSGGDGFVDGTNSNNHVYYDSTWNTSMVPADDYYNQDGNLDSSQLSGYLQWLDDEKVPENNNSTTNGDGDIDEIDRLADKFIASFHEKFRLEKQESYRRYQEMLARSV